MPEVFQNNYEFLPGAVPDAEAFCKALSEKLSMPFEVVKKLARQEDFNERAFCNLKAQEFSISIDYENDRPAVMATVDRPMERMIQVNAAMVSLGGKPRHPDQFWRDYSMSRTIQMVKKIIVLLGVLAIVVTIIIKLGIWGFLLVVVLLGLAAWAYIMALARAFRK